MLELKVAISKIKDFLDYLYVERGLAINTVTSYKSDICHFTESMKEDLIIDNNTISKYFASIAHMTKSTLKRRIASLRGWLEFCIDTEQDNNKTESKKFTFPDVGKVHNNINLISHHNLSLLKKNTISLKSPRNLILSTMIDFLYSTGMRISEMLSVKYEDIKPIIECTTKSIVVKGKGSKERLVFITEKMHSILVEYCNRLNIKSGSLWIINGKQISRNMVYNWMSKICNLHSIRGISPHALRHRLGSDLLQQDMNVMSIQKILGHTSVNTTQIYTHLEDKKLYDALKKFHPIGNKDD